MPTPTKITYFDIEVFSDDWLIVFNTDGYVRHVWNNADEVRSIVANTEALCGFNIANYDVPILRAIMLGADNAAVKRVNDLIISGVSGYMAVQGSVELPVLIDLFQDIVPRKSLKEIAGNLGLSIVESSVSFDIGRPLTETERNEVLQYCRSDVSVTMELAKHRKAYVDAKFSLCDIVGLDYSEVRRTNAGLVAKALSAEKKFYPVEDYVIPDNVDVKRIPNEILDFVTQANTENAVDTAPDYLKLKAFDVPVAGIDAVFGLGGIHAALPNYSAVSDDTYTIVYQDITSYYPSLAIINGHISRSAGDPDAYRKFYDLRVKAKAEGDSATAEAAKLVLNTTFGASKSLYNDLYDPIQGISICLSGQLYIVELMERLDKILRDWEIIQINTDGWILKVNTRELEALEQEIRRFTERTGFNVETKSVMAIYQRDVNNYVVQFDGGRVETKGGDFGAFPEPNIKAGSLAIVAKAIVLNLAWGAPIEDTIASCDDPKQFQIIHKAGSTFSRVTYEMDGEEVEAQRVNRMYAVKDTRYGIVRKHKPGGGSQKIPLCPPHTMIDNGNETVTGDFKDLLDMDFYVNLAYTKLDKIVGNEKRKKNDRTGKASEQDSLF